MNLPYARVLAFSILCCGILLGSAQADNGYKKQKVVYHLNNVHSAKATFRNIRNHLNAVGDKNVDLVVVTHSSGAFSLVEGAMGKKGKNGKAYNFTGSIASLAARGVKFQICANTIRGKKINKDDIDMHAETVPSGVAEIAKLQQSGYVYLKP